MMKKMILAAAAAASLIGAGALATSADAMPMHGGGHGPVMHGGFGGRGGYRGPTFRGGYRGGFYGHRWARGGFWPRGYGVVIYDPGFYGLYEAPYGYEWVRDDYGQLVLVRIDTGLIADVIIR
jgi:Ni/Co efflux regulator RcnB